MSDDQTALILKRLKEERPARSAFLRFVFLVSGYRVPADSRDQIALSRPLEKGAPLRIGDVAFALRLDGRARRSYFYIGDGRWLSCDRVRGVTYHLTSSIRRSVVFRRFTIDVDDRWVLLDPRLAAEARAPGLHYWFLAHGDGIMVNRLRREAEKMGLEYGSILTSAVTRRIPGIDAELKKLSR